MSHHYTLEPYDNSNIKRDYHLYESQASLPESTLSASSGYIHPQQRAKVVDAAAQRFRAHHPSLNETPVIDGLGRLNIDVFRTKFPIVGKLLPHVVTMTTNMLYNNNVLQSWPNSEALEAIALSALQIICDSHENETKEIVERCKFLDFTTNLSVDVQIPTVPPGMPKAVAQWVVPNVRSGIEDILVWARTFMSGFDLTDSNDIKTNLRNFHMATYLSTYLHLYSICKSPTQRVSSPFQSCDFFFLLTYQILANSFCIYESGPSPNYPYRILLLNPLHCTTDVLAIWNLP